MTVLAVNELLEVLLAGLELRNLFAAQHAEATIRASVSHGVCAEAVVLSWYL